jgi:hypothetical protein
LRRDQLFGEGSVIAKRSFDSAWRSEHQDQQAPKTQAHTKHAHPLKKRTFPEPVVTLKFPSAESGVRGGDSSG